MRRRCIRPLVVKAIGGLSMTPSDTRVMPQKIHPNSGIGDARERSNFERFEIASQTRIHLVGLRRSLVSLSRPLGLFSITSVVCQQATSTHQERIGHLL